MTEIGDSVAYVLIETQPGKEGHVYDTLKKIPGIEDVHLLHGEYDIIVKIASKDSHHKIGKKVVYEIRPVEGVEMTTTLLCLKPDAFLKSEEHL